MMNDILAQALSKINNAAARGKPEVTLYPSSKVVTRIMTLLKEEGYIADFKSENTTRGTVTTVQLNGKINKVGAIKPRFSVKMDTYEKFEKRYLPAKDFGRIFISTTDGIITHIKSKESNQGGVLIAYVY